MSRPVHVAVGDRVELRKPHPCGGTMWVVVRVGADIGLVCERCGRRVLLDRVKFNRRVRRVVSPRPTPDRSGKR
ncbi:MAG: DUF951 domain-containing protein [Ardenticatenia bacterium]|nr:DUF951 domain-containing protein [Ardenticatenia bacterium]